MYSFAITCCSTVDLTRDMLSSRSIPYAAFHYTLGEQSYLEDFGESIPYHDFYRAAANGAELKTAQVNISEYLDLFLPLLAEGKDILHICLSSGLSGTINSARNAALIAQEQYPERKIFIVDSLGASSGYGMLVDTIADMRDEGLTIEECMKRAEELKLRIHHWFISTDLTWYVRGGRISKAAGLMGNMLGICPLLNMDANGCLIPRYRIRSKKKAIREMAARMLEYADGSASYKGKCWISHSDCLEDALALKSLLQDTFPNLSDTIRIFDVGTTIGSHTGPGTVALYFFGQSRVE